MPSNLSTYKLIDIWITSILCPSEFINLIFRYNRPTHSSIHLWITHIHSMHLSTCYHHTINQSMYHCMTRILETYQCIYNFYVLESLFIFHAFSRWLAFKFLYLCSYLLTYKLMDVWITSILSPSQSMSLILCYDLPED